MEDFERINELKKERILARRAKRRNQVLWCVAICSSVVLLFLSVNALLLQAEQKKQEEANAGVLEKYIETAPTIKQQLLASGTNSRPGTKLETVTAVVIHFSKEAEASAHFGIGKSGEITQYIPLEEVSLAVDERKEDTISIVCSTNFNAGKLTEETYDSLVYVTAWLVGKYDLKIEDIIRHYDVDGTECPTYFVKYESAWEDFKLDVEKYIDQNGVKKETKR